MAGTDDLAPLLSRHDPSRADYGQGVLTAWNPVTFENTVRWQEVVLSNTIIAPGVDALSFQPGDPVLLQILKPPGGGMPTFVVTGHMNVPPLDNPVAIRGGTLIVDTADGIEVFSGGSVEVNDGGSITARYNDGSTAIVYGSLVTQPGGEPDGHGLLVQDDQSGSSRDIFRAKRDLNGLKLVFVGSTDQISGDPVPVDAMRIWASDLELHQIGSGDLTNEIISILADSRVFIGADDDIDLNAGEDIFITAADQIQLSSGSDLVFASSATTGNSPNVELGSDFAAFRRSTSSRRYKTDLGDYAAPRTILDLKPRTYRDKTEAEADPDTARTHVGLVAEEVHDLGLHEYVTYDDQGRPDAVRYDRLAVGLLGIVQDLAGWAQAQGWVPQEGSALPMPVASPNAGPKPRNGHPRDRAR